MYKCKYCGKEFESCTDLGGHVSCCEKFLTAKYGSVQQYKSLLKSKNALMNQRKKEEKLQQWIAEQHKCKTYGCVMTTRYGSGQFCSRACANTRHHSDITKSKISAGVDRHNVQNGIVPSKLIPKSKNVATQQQLAVYKFCDICGNILNKRNISGLCGKCFLSNRPESTRKKQHDKMVGRSRWNIRRGQTSFAENFFIGVLTNLGIEFQREFPVKTEDNVHCYFLDFLICVNENKIDLEIDGKQHLQRVEQDCIRDDYLSKIGYKVFRIKFEDVRSEKGKQNIQHSIDKFVEFYNSL